MSVQNYIQRLEAIGQNHLFEHWCYREKKHKDALLTDLAEYKTKDIQFLQRILSRKAQRKLLVQPTSYHNLANMKRDITAVNMGDELLRSGRVGLLTVAGGQGSRLGLKGPKGIFPVTPIRKASLYQLFAEKVRAASKKYEIIMQWYIMTSRDNHDDTVRFFQKNTFFGLDGKSIHFFVQQMIPALYPDGRLVLGTDGGIFKNPNGHGGVINALRDSGLIEDMVSRGIEELSYFQIDNPLVNITDSLFLGIHRREESEMSTKVVKKLSANEKLGVIGFVNGKPGIIEYSDLNEQNMYALDQNGELLFSQGSIAVHIVNIGLLVRKNLDLPFHQARKVVKTLIPTPQGADFKEEEVIKFELFVFDAISRAKNPIFLETIREEEFATLKNRHGSDSIETCRRGQIEKYARWLELCGVRVPRDNSGNSIHAIEISPLFASDITTFKAKIDKAEKEIHEDKLYL